MASFENQAPQQDQRSSTERNNSLMALSSFVSAALIMVSGAAGAVAGNMSKRFSGEKGFLGGTLIAGSATAILSGISYLRSSKVITIEDDNKKSFVSSQSALTTDVSAIADNTASRTDGKSWTGSVGETTGRQRG